MHSVCAYMFVQRSALNTPVFTHCPWCLFGRGLTDESNIAKCSAPFFFRFGFGVVLVAERHLFSVYLPALIFFTRRVTEIEMSVYVGYNLRANLQSSCGSIHCSLRFIFKKCLKKSTSFIRCCVLAVVRLIF